MAHLLFDCRNSKADGCECRFVDGATLGDLEEQAFACLLETGPAENYDTVRSFTVPQPSPAEQELFDRKLLARAPSSSSGNPAFVNLARQLHLRRKNLDRGRLRIHNREQNNHGAAFVHDFRDTGPDMVTFAFRGRSSWSVESRERCVLLSL